ncbi:MAG: hypothetical protein U0270_23680 [Labilithrix sp.]
MPIDFAIVVPAENARFLGVLPVTFQVTHDPRGHSRAAARAEMREAPPS